MRTPPTLWPVANFRRGHSPALYRLTLLFLRHYVLLLGEGDMLRLLRWLLLGRRRARLTEFQKTVADNLLDATNYRENRLGG